MKLRGIEIRNFRSILFEQIHVKDCALLVGANNSGKSSVIDAIRAFYENDGFKFDRKDDFPHSKAESEEAQEAWIELEFELTDDEFVSLAEDYKSTNKRLTVRKYFLTNKKTTDGKPAVGYIFAYNSKGELTDSPFYGAKNVQSGKFGKLIYIPAISKVDEHAKLSGPSDLRDLLTDVVTLAVEQGSAFENFASNLEAFSNAIRREETADGRSLASFEAELNSLLEPWNSNFSLKFPAPTPSDIVKSMVSWEVVDQLHGKPQSISSYGTGFQRHFIYSLISMGSKYGGRRSTKKSKDFVPSLTLLLFEEPEAFLHPPQQELLAQSLRTLSETTDWQVLCTTHSSLFVSKNANDIPSIIRMQREGDGSSAYQVSDEEWAEIVDANMAINSIAEKYPKFGKRLHELDAKPEMEAVKHLLWLNNDRSSLFFSNHVLLVEGPTEVALVKRLLDHGKLSGLPNGFFVIDTIGKYNVHRFMALLSAFGIRHSVLYDGDNEVEYNAEVNQLINDSRSCFTTEIASLASDLERFFEIPSGGAPHRKPQHVLYLYETGQIAQSKIDAFCEILRQSCLKASR